MKLRENIKSRSTGTVYTSAKACLISVAIWIRIHIRIRIRIRDPDRHQNLILFTGPLPTFHENFMQIRSEVFCEKLLTDKQTNNDENTISLAEVGLIKRSNRITKFTELKIILLICNTSL